MKAFYLPILSVGLMTVFLHGEVSAQVTDNITRRHISPDVRHTTLLVMKYEPHDAADTDFGRQKVSKFETEKFLEKTNDHLVKKNHELYKVMMKYNYDFRIVSKKDLDYFDDLDKYRYVLDRNLVKLVLNKKHGHFLDHYTYSYFFTDRKTNRSFVDINMYYNDPNKTEKIIILELNDFLEEIEIEEAEREARQNTANTTQE